MTPLVYALLVYLGYLIVGLGLAAAGMWAWMILGGRRDRRRKLARPGALPDSVFWNLVEREFPEEHRP